MKKNKEFDVERREYDEKIEEIRKKKRKLRDIQEPGLVKKIKKDLKVEQRAAKRSSNHDLRNYVKEQIYLHEEEGGLIFSLRESLFGFSDDEAIPVIDKYLEKYPELLEIHDKDWYYKYC